MTSSGSTSIATSLSQSRRPLLLLLVVLALAASAGPVAASEMGDDPTVSASLRLAAERVAVPMSAVSSPQGVESSAMWFSQTLGRRYTLTDLKGAGLSGSRVAAQDVATDELIGYGDLPAPWYHGGRQVEGGASHVAVVDDVGSRLFVAQELRNEATPADKSAAATGGAASQGEFCGGHNLGKATVTAYYCFGGWMVMDADTLEYTGRIPYRSVSVDSGAVGAQLLASHLAPPIGDEAGPKLLGLVTESVHHGVQSTFNPRTATQQNPTYVVQWDADSGAQEWALRLDGCRGVREPTNSEESQRRAFRGHTGAVFRTLADQGSAAIIVGCHNSSAYTGTAVYVPLDEHGVPALRPVRVGDPSAVFTEFGEGDPREASPDSVGQPTSAPLTFPGPDRVVDIISDPDSQRILMRVVDGGAEVWWVFDGTVNQFIGTVGIGAVPTGGSASAGSSMTGLDRVAGRLYVLAYPVPERGFAGGLFLADIRRTPVAQALHYPEFVGLAVHGGAGAGRELYVQPAGTGTPARIHVPDKDGPEPSVADNRTYLIPSPRRGYRVIEDHLPPTVDPEEPEFAGRTLDLDEIEGVTQSSFDGTARGYGARVLLVGGADGVLRAGPVDPMGAVYTCNDRTTTGDLTMPCHPEALDMPVASPCTDSTRDITLAFVGPGGSAVVDASGARGAAEPMVVDSATRADSEAPASRCSGEDWDQLWGTALFGSAPAGEPRVPWVFDNSLAECVSGQDPVGTVGDPVAGAFSARVQCTENEAAGFAYARGANVGGLMIAETLSSFRIYRDPGRGIVARVESVVRGVSIDGVLRLDTVRGTAESWANGRVQPVAVTGREEGYNPNCDHERTAGTCFRAHIFGVWTPAFACGPCGDEEVLIDRLSRSMGAYGSVRLRKPNPQLARGAENGFIAAVTKPGHERFADLVLNNDLLQTVVPTLEIIRQAPPSRPLSGGGTRGRQIIQLAGVEVSTSYGIACLLVYDEAANTCAEPAEAPGSIQVTLSDTDGKPLAGGAFEVRADVDADGVLGLKDTLLPDGACVTAEDGVGTCVFENLQPGTYLVSQVAAPPGYTKSAEPWVSEVASGEQRTVAFTNVSNVSTIDLTATDENGAPLSGATFAAYPDADSDGKVAPDAQPAAECTTDAQGVCTMKVPAGSYVLVQTSAPGGLEGIEPVPFTFASGGQVASVTVVNYPPASPSQPEAAASPIYTPPVDMAPPREFIDTTYVPPAESDAPLVDAPAPSFPAKVGGTVTQVIRAPGDALRLLARDPKQAVAWTAALALFVLAAMAIRRRQQAIALIRG